MEKSNIEASLIFEIVWICKNTDNELEKVFAKVGQINLQWFFWSLNNLKNITNISRERQRPSGQELK